MSRRMGVRPGVHLRSLLIEVGTLVGLDRACGTVAATAGFALIVSSLDVFPDLPPGARFALPVTMLLATAAVVLAVAVIASFAAHPLAERADPADVLRLE